MTKPNLFLVGQPRSGTTSLYRYLDQHPEIYMCPFKEPRYFARDLHREGDRFHGRPSYFAIRTEAQYLELFAGAGGQPIVGEASPQYLFSHDAAGLIHDFCPEARILIILREPVDFLYSWYTELKARLHETAPSFEAALDLEPRRREGFDIPNTVGTPSFLYYSEWVRYGDGIRRYLDCFAKEQIKIIAFDDLTRANGDSYREVLCFLGVDPEFEADFEIHNTHKVPRFPAIRRITRHPLVWNLARKLIPQSVYGAADDILSQVLTRPEIKQPIDDALRDRLRARFRPEVEDVSRLTDRDFAGLWGY